MVIYEGLLTHLFTHGVTETSNKYHAFLDGHVWDDACPSVIITHTYNNGLKASSVGYDCKVSVRSTLSF